MISPHTAPGTLVVYNDRIATLFDKAVGRLNEIRWGRCPLPDLKEGAVYTLAAIVQTVDAIGRERFGVYVDEIGHDCGWSYAIEDFSIAECAEALDEWIAKQKLVRRKLVRLRRLAYQP